MDKEIYFCDIKTVYRHFTISSFQVYDYEMRAFLSIGTSKEQTFFAINSIDGGKYLIPSEGVLVSFNKIS